MNSNTPLMLMLDQLQSSQPSFLKRLSEAVSWCTGQSLESNPAELPEIRERRRLGQEAGRLSQRAHFSGAPRFWKSLLRRRAVELFSRAKLHEIVPLAHQLRSPLLKPNPFEYPQSPDERVRIVEAVADKRAEHLRIENRYPTGLLKDLAGGRLLLYSPDENLCDGAAQYSSKGFFDVNNIPPWDTWVCFSDRYHLISWVPPQLLELANQGIEVNPEQCILWAPETGLPNA